MTDIETLLPRIIEATERLKSTTANLSDDDFTAPSACDGWSRAHVLAHLALNAEALAGAVKGALTGAGTAMYASNEDRDGDIDALAAEPPAAVRSRLSASADEFAAAAADLPSDHDGTFERTPGGQIIPVRRVPIMRLREVEIHHADLLAGYTADDWPTATAERFLTGEVKRLSDATSFRVRATDLDASFTLGDGTGPLVSGTAAALAWWMTGRSSSGVTSDSGELPEVSA